MIGVTINKFGDYAISRMMLGGEAYDQMMKGA